MFGRLESFYSAATCVIVRFLQVRDSTTTAGGPAVASWLGRVVPTATAARVPTGWPQVHHGRAQTEFRHVRQIRVQGRPSGAATAAVSVATGTADSVQQQHQTVAATARRGWLATVQSQRASAMGLRDERQRGNANKSGECTRMNLRRTRRYFVVIISLAVFSVYIFIFSYFFDIFRT